MDDSNQPITERTNPLSSNIDIHSPVDIVSTLQACDEEIFNGWRDFPGLFDDRIQRSLSTIADVATSILKDATGKSAIIFSGCGTSGRIGFIAARTFNADLKHRAVTECYSYIMAGGDKALFTSQEAEEDNPLLGARLLEQALEGKSRVLFIGITCSMSSPFVAGQIDYCLQHLDRFTPVLVGFNPAHIVRNTPIEKWNQTALQVVQRLEAAESKGQGFLLNPVVGPEPITGSSRMKGGTATKLLLESVLIPAHAACFHHNTVSIKDYLLLYKQVWDQVYSEKSDIAAILQLAGTSLKQGGHVYYVGGGSLGMMGLIDASECPPTYGSAFEDVRGFLEGGYQTLGNAGGDLSNLGKRFQISTQDFVQQIISVLSDKDIVIFICKDEEGDQLPKEMSHAVHCKKALIAVNTKKDVPANDDSTLAAKVTVDLTEVTLGSAAAATTTAALDVGLQSRAAEVFAQLAVKWTLNAVSTGAHILKGKVINNIMIDLKPSNVKLFHRATGIIQRYSKLPVEECRDYLLRSLYDTDDVSEEIRSASIAQHIKIGAVKPRVVPTGLLAALLKTSIREADIALASQPVVRQVILDCLSGQ